MGHTLERPGGDAAVVRVPGHNKALAMTSDCTPRYCQAHPKTGGAQAVAETWRNLTAVGAKPLAITDCMNFGNPERPEIMGQFVGAIEGMREACIALDYPVVSGNVSLYNETKGTGVQPTPTIGGVGVIADLSRSCNLALKNDGDCLVVVGETTGHLGASMYAREIANTEAGAPPPVDLAVERRNGDFVRGLIENGEINACHDVSDGGLAVALADMALAGNRGIEITAETLLEKGLAEHAWLFGEDQGRYVLSCPAEFADQLISRAAEADVPAKAVGIVAGKALKLTSDCSISLATLKDAFENWLPDFMTPDD
jgi:phosphoribosylformylglycinamidine synthase